MGLDYVPGPKLDWYLREPADLSRLKGGGELVSQLAFQGEAMKLTRAALVECALDDADLRRLTAIIQLKRRLSGGQPKEASSKGSKKPKAPAADIQDILNLGL